MIPVQKVGLGLLSAFGIKGNGQNPRALEEGYRASLEVGPMLLAPELTAQQVVATSVSAADAGATMTVGDSEAWYMVAMSYTALQFSGAGICNIRLTIVPITGSVGTVISPPFRATGGVGISYTQGVMFPQPTILRPGTRVLALTNEAVTTGTCSIAISALFYRLGA